jgi:hypothetical protein
MNIIEKLQNINSLRGQTILKAFGQDDDFEKARSGIYVNTHENRKLGRVGKHYGSKKEEEKKEEVSFKKNDIIEIEGGNYLRYQNTKNIQTSIHPYPTKDILYLYKNQEVVKEALKRVDSGEIPWDDISSFYDPTDFILKDNIVATIPFDKSKLKVSDEKFNSAASAYDDYVIIFEGDENIDEKLFDGRLTKMQGIKAIYKKNKNNKYDLIELNGKEVKIKE